jgi:hypothetical protein
MIVRKAARILKAEIRMKSEGRRTEGRNPNVQGVSGEKLPRRNAKSAKKRVILCLSAFFAFSGGQNGSRFSVLGLRVSFGLRT